jgi:hypothetical protein
MFKPTTFIALLGAVVAGLIVADFLRHPAGTKAVANGAVSIATPTIAGLEGK